MCQNHLFYLCHWEESKRVVRVMPWSMINEISSESQMRRRFLSDRAALLVWKFLFSVIYDHTRLLMWAADVPSSNITLLFSLFASKHTKRLFKVISENSWEFVHLLFVVQTVTIRKLWKLCWTNRCGFDDTKNMPQCEWHTWRRWRFTNSSLCWKIFSPSDFCSLNQRFQFNIQLNTWSSLRSRKS